MSSETPDSKKQELELKEPVQRFKCIPVQMKKNLDSYLTSLIKSSATSKRVVPGGKGKIATIYRVTDDYKDKLNQVLGPETVEEYQPQLEQVKNNEFTVYFDSSDQDREFAYQLGELNLAKKKTKFERNKEANHSEVELSDKLRNELANIKFAFTELIPDCTSAGRVAGRWLKKKGVKRKQLIDIAGFNQISNCKNLKPLVEELTRGIEYPELRETFAQQSKRLTDILTKSAEKEMITTKKKRKKRKSK